MKFRKRGIEKEICNCISMEEEQGYSPSIEEVVTEEKCVDLGEDCCYDVVEN